MYINQGFIQVDPFLSMNLEIFLLFSLSMYFLALMPFKNALGKLLQKDNQVKLMERMRVKMTLDYKLLIWLPLPPAAVRRAVAKKIIAVFESVAVAFFDELATMS